jgi:hypothetical protein
MVVLWCLMPLSTIFQLYRRFWNGLFMVFNATFNNIGEILLKVALNTIKQTIPKSTI